MSAAAKLSTIDEITNNSPVARSTDRYARGWHVLGKASTFTSEPQLFDVFGTRLVAYRGEDDNQTHVLDAYCPHMGADLSKGCVRSNSIVCPFHAWVWGSDGECEEIPYAKRIPAKAKIKAWPCLEENGLLFVWHDPENNPPIETQRPRRIDEYFSGEWTDWNMKEFEIQTHCRELVDNMADMGHFGPVHYSSIGAFRNEQDGHTFTQYMEGGHDILTEGSTPMTSVATYEGPAYMTTTMTGAMDGTPMKVHLLVSHTPIDHGKFTIRFGVTMQKLTGLTEKQNQAMVDEYTQMNIDSFIQDVEIWDNKIRIDNPVLCDGDGPINMVRKWYSQFYMDVADIPEQITRHKEHVTQINNH